MKRWTGVFPQFRGIAGLALVGLVLAACGSSSATSTAAVLGATGTPAPRSTPVATATATATVAAASSSGAPAASDNGPTGVPTSLDPCTLITAQEAGQLAGATFGAGTEDTTSGNGKICTYGGQTLNVFDVFLGVAPDAATAQAEKTAAEAQVQSQLSSVGGPKVQFTELPTFADGAAYATDSISLSGQTIGVSGFYFLKGATFVGFSDLALGKAALSLATMQGEATIVLGRLP